MKRTISLRIRREDHASDSLGRIFLGDDERESTLERIRSYLGPHAKLKSAELEADTLLVTADVREFAEESRNLLRMARDARRKGRVRSAAGHYEEALKLSPWNAEALKALGRAFYQSREHEAARLHLVRASEADPADGTVLALLAEIAIHEARRPAARQYLERLQALEPDNPRVAPALARLVPEDLREIRREMSARRTRAADQAATDNDG